MKTLLMISALLLVLTACGKGETPGTVRATVSGVASKGPIRNATVTVRDLSGKVVGSGTTNSDGSFSVDVMDYKGPVIVTISDGNYLDEATGVTVTLSSPLRAAFGNASAATRIMVTPLTEIAVQKAVSAGLSTSSIATANSAVSTAFGLDNIITTQPVTPAGAFSSTQSYAEKYANALANISLLAQAQPGKTIAEIITDNLSPTAINNDGSWATVPTNYNNANGQENITIWPNKSSSLVSGGINLYAKARNAPLATQVTFSIPGGQALSGIANLGGMQSSTVAIAAEGGTGPLYASTQLTSPVAGSVTVNVKFTNNGYSTASASTVVSFVDKVGEIIKIVRLSGSGVSKVSTAAATAGSDLTYMNVDVVSSATGGSVDKISTSSTYFSLFDQRDATTTRAVLSNGGGVPSGSLNPLFTITYGYSSSIPTFTVAPYGKVKFNTYSTTLTSGDFEFQ